MAKINDTTTYPNTAPALTDHVPGTDVSNTANDANGETVTFTLQAILDLVEANGAAPASFLASGTLADARVAASNVTQHQAALSITESQISDLGTYLTDVVGDTTPQLGGNLDVNGNSIVSTANGNITIAPNGTGNVVLGNYTLDADATVGAGQDGYVLKYTHSNGTWAPAVDSGAGGGISNVVEDTTPQLGGNLDLNTNGITFPGATVTDVTGSDTLVVSGTAGTSGDLAVWNVDGDLVDGPTPPSGTIVGTTDTQTLTGKTIAGGSASSQTNQLQTRVDTAANWTSNNPTLASGEMGVESDTGQFKIGDGSTAWTSLNYVSVGEATASDVNTGTSTTVAITPDALAGSNFGTQVVQLLVFDDSEDVATGDGAGDIFFRVPSTMNGMNLVGVAAAVQTAGTTGTTDVQIHNVTDTADMLSTKITIDSAETDSSTAATAAVINAATDDVATGDILRIDVDAVSTTAPKGLLVELQFRLP